MLARGLAIQAGALNQAELFTAGIRSATEGVAIFRELADADPTRLLDVSQALNSLSVLLQSAGRAADALEPALEAVVHLKGLTAADERRFLPELADAVRQHADVLGDLGRVPEAAAAFQDALPAYSGSDWSRGVLLTQRSRWHAENDRTRAAVEDAIVAARLLDGAGDGQRRAESREVLRALHQEDPGLVLGMWQESTSEPVPVWLRFSVVDDETGQLLIDWMDFERGEGTVEYLTEHEARLLTDDAEAGMEHLVDDNVGYPVVTEYLDVLRSARANGIAVAAAELYDLMALERAYDHIQRWANTSDWSASAEYLEANADELLTDVAMRAITAEVPSQPHLLVHHGLLGLSRTMGIERAYAVLSCDPTAVTDPPDDLDAARLRAGFAGFRRCAARPRARRPARRRSRRSGMGDHPVSSRELSVRTPSAAAQAGAVRRRAWDTHIPEEEDLPFTELPIDL